MKMSITDRFMGYVKKTDSCWLWTGALNPYGYGRFYWSPRSTTIGSHRASWMLFWGEIPDGLYVCHSCDVRECVNPDHLFIGTHGDNFKDAIAKGRIKHGPAHYQYRITDSDMVSVHAMLDSGFHIRTVADLLSMSVETAYKIKRKEYRAP